ncbi:MAG: tRNA uridine-5-carboxymethylaminomethyl(34) synthesis enzyme MnmG, partial [Muribaculum sp.]|nr:tRNA uridine-5-carboxymethylaminomethyl(34) synthesis enzyme MnmG [Muribaculum sp.]
IVREIDALGGMMGIITDRTAIQFRMLNRSRGPAMWSPRAQSDRMKFSGEWRRILENTPGLCMWQDSVASLIFDGNEVKGVVTVLGVKFHSRAVVLTAGTFLNGLMHVGRAQVEGGRVSEPASHGITEQLADFGFVTARMKTGTPVRIDGRSVKWELTSPQEGENDFHKFSYLPEVKRELRQRQCYTVYTNPATHDILREGLPDSPLYNGQIKSIGPRYCPSIETKIVTFADKDEHQLFLEPEGEDTQEFYLNGFSSSLPLDIQVRALSTVPALSEVQIYRPGYAIEYDFFDPTQLNHTLETKMVDGLFFAGQVNGTTGYEEAAGQGLVAGANAAARALGLEQLVLSRDEAYIGVLIDDLVTKGVDEPYRMFTSRAEYRILLRQDDADMRLTPRGHELGLVDDERYSLIVSKREQRDRLIDFVRNFSLKPALINDALEKLGTSPLKQGVKLVDLIMRPQITIRSLMPYIDALRHEVERLEDARRDEIIEAAEILIKYQGYIDREKLVADKIHRLEELKLPATIDYASMKSLSTEARQKLEKIRPVTVAQASRIPGISPSDINVLLLLMGR